MRSSQACASRAARSRGLTCATGARACLSAIAARRVVLACGHSARDTFDVVHGAGVAMEQKPFSVGVRIEHDQGAVNRAQYGDAAAHPRSARPTTSWPCTCRTAAASYTFCMCPGGEVVCAASEEGGVVVNGMSRFARDGANANAALLVGVGPEDFGSDHPLAGVELQRRMERAAYRGGALARAARRTRRRRRRWGTSWPDARARRGASVRPTYARGVAWCDLRRACPVSWPTPLPRRCPCSIAACTGSRMRARS